MKKRTILTLFLIPLICACAVKAVTASNQELTPYGSFPTSTVQSEPAGTTSTPLPTPSPTPQYHTVQTGETMSSIAYQYGVDVNDVMASNPDINPNAMVTGMQLLIPARTASAATAGAESTPASVVLSEPVCTKEKSGGLWCFVMASNENTSALENVLVEITLGDESASTLTAQVAAAPLNLLPGKGQLPLAVYFPPPIPEPYRYSVTLQSAIAVEDESRYLKTEIQEQTVTISNDGLSAQINARLLVSGSAGENVRVWLAVVALDENGTVVGVRRLETIATLDTQGVVMMNGYVYSTGTVIDAVQLTAEAMQAQS